MRRVVAAVLAVLLVVSVSARADEKEKAPGLEGYWLGKLKPSPVIELRLGLNVTKKDGSLTATFDSIDQGARNIPVDEVSLKDGTVKFAIKKLSASYEGTLSKDGQKIDGKFMQGAASFPLVLERQEKPFEVARPQVPKKPYPYAEEEVVVENAQAKLKLAGTLTLPKGTGPFPAAVLITGSGPQDRDESLMGHKPFLILADHLTRQGIAVLRCDDRGVGKSTGDFGKATTADFATDAEACVAYLKTRKEIDSQKIGLIGHSEGGLIAPMVAAKDAGIAFIVMLAGPGLNGEEVLYKQGQDALKAAGVKEKELQQIREQQEIVFKLIKEEKDPEKIKQRIEELEKEQVAKLTEEQKKEYEKVKSVSQAQKAMLLTPWFRYFLMYDPAPTLAKVKCPVLAINGEKDVQVAVKENLQAIEKALASGGTKDVTVKELAGLNHLFQTAKTGAVSEYGQIEETFAPSALELISQWIVKRTH